MKCEKIFEIIDSMNDEYLDFLSEVCKIESPTEYKEGVDRVGKYFIEKAEKHGWTVEKQSQNISGDVVCITMNPDAKGAPICFSGHMDTVHPVGSFGDTPVRIDGNRMHGPGITDCKGGLVASFMAMDALEKCGYNDRPVKLILQSDEENGSRNSNKTTVQYMCEKAKGAIAVLNTEPGLVDAHITTTKGICKFRFEITGKAEHSAACYNGASAIAEAANKIIKLEKYKDPKTITCNCGLINGGSAENTVPEKCTFTADFRFNTEEEKDKIMQIAAEIAAETTVAGTSCKYVLASNRSAMPKTQRNTELFEKVRAIYLDNGLGDIKQGITLGGTDAAYFTLAGVPCLEGFGLFGGYIHNLNEYAEIDSLAFAAKRLAAVAYCIE